MERDASVFADSNVTVPQPWLIQTFTVLFTQQHLFYHSLSSFHATANDLTTPSLLDTLFRPYNMVYFCFEGEFHLGFHGLLNFLEATYQEVVHQKCKSIKIPYLKVSKNQYYSLIDCFVFLKCLLLHLFLISLMLPRPGLMLKSVTVC